jgi:hypothetical protein
MRKLILATFIATLPFAATAADEELAGTYKLISYTRTRLETGQVETFGKQQGFITYGTDGLGTNRTNRADQTMSVDRGGTEAAASRPKRRD